MVSAAGLDATAREWRTGDGGDGVGDALLTAAIRGLHALQVCGGVECKGGKGGQ